MPNSIATASRGVPPGPQQDAQQTSQIVAILFADVANSTKLYESHGNKLAYGLIGACLRLLDREARAAQGETLKTAGDGILCSFAEAASALRAAQAMQFRLLDDPRLQENQVAVKIGLHFGQVIATGNDAFGDAVNVASRLSEMAGGGQVLLTQDIIEASDEENLPLRLVGRKNIKGKDSKITVFELLWNQGSSDQTQVMEATGQFMTMQEFLVLEHAGQAWEISPAHPRLSLGRLPENEIQLAHKHVSKRHCTISFENNSFTIADHSTNGTYIYFDKADPIHLHHDACKLAGTGIICPGQRGEDTWLAVKFRVSFPGG